jgi:hypothetical protein
MADLAIAQPRERLAALEQCLVDDGPTLGRNGCGDLATAAPSRVAAASAA